MADDDDTVRSIDSWSMQQRKQRELELVAAAFPASASAITPAPAAAPNPIAALMQMFQVPQAGQASVPVATPRVALPENWQSMVTPRQQPVGNFTMTSPQGAERVIRRFR